MGNRIWFWGRRGGKVRFCKPLDFSYAFALLASTYGWTHPEILALTARQFFLYLHQIFKLSSAKQLQMFEASLLPHMKESDRRSVIEGYRQVVIPVKVDEREIEKAWDLLRKGRGNYGR